MNSKSRKYFIPTLILFGFITIFSHHVNAFNDCDSNLKNVNILTPNGGESYLELESITVYWETCDIQVPTDYVNVKLVHVDSKKNMIGDPIILAKHVPNIGHTEILLPRIDRTSLYLISIRREGGTADISDNYFKIINTPIDIVSPNGGQMYTSGDNIEVSWVSDLSISSDVIIQLAKYYNNEEDPTEWFTLSQATLNDGFENVTLPEVVEPGSYKINVKILANGIGDYSDNYITIIPDLVVATDTATDIFETKAKINGTYNGYYIGKAIFTWFEYGVTPDLGSSTPTVAHVCACANGTPTDETLFTESLIDLLPGTPYYYRAMAQYGGLSVTYGETQSFLAL